MYGYQNISAIDSFSRNFVMIKLKHQTHGFVLVT